MSIFDRATEEYRDRRHPDSDGDADEDAYTAASVSLGGRQSTVTVAGEQFDLEQPETVQTGDEGTWLTAEKYGRPRGRDALEARQVSQTAAMETITNGVIDQLIGGELVFESDDDDVDSAEAELQALLRDVLNGPHPMGNDLDDLVTAAVADMMGPGNAYWQLLPPSEGDLPVAALIPLDALTIRHNVTRHGLPEADEAPFYQAMGAFSSEGVAAMGSIKPVPLEAEQLAVMHYPRGKRPYQIYPKSPSLQVLEWLEVLVNSTTHHNRYYSDNEIPPGLLQVLNASDRTVNDLQDRIQDAVGDPRSIEVIGGEGQAMWVEMGGTAINLDVIEEQKWFFQLCLGALGLGKAELGFIEDANRSNGEVEQSRIYKRVAGPFAKQFERAFMHVCQQFDVFTALDKPFTPKLRFNDPEAERARQERLRKQYQTGLITYNDFLAARGKDPDDVDTTVELVEGVTIDYGDKPKPIVESMMIARRMEAMAQVQAEEDVAEEMEAAFDTDDEHGSEAVPLGGGADGHPSTNGGGA